MYSVSASVRWSRNSVGVRPAACTSFSRGSEIFPSGRTGTVRVISVLFHTATSRTSSGPITNCPGQRSACAGASCAAADRPASRTAATRATTPRRRRALNNVKPLMSMGIFDSVDGSGSQSDQYLMPRNRVVREGGIGVEVAVLSVAVECDVERKILGDRACDAQSQPVHVGLVPGFHASKHAGGNPDLHESPTVRRRRCQALNADDVREPDDGGLGP